MENTRSSSLRADGCTLMDQRTRGGRGGDLIDRLLFPPESARIAKSLNSEGTWVLIYERSE